MRPVWTLALLLPLSLCCCTADRLWPGWVWAGAGEDEETSPTFGQKTSVVDVEFLCEEGDSLCDQARIGNIDLFSVVPYMTQGGELFYFYSFTDATDTEETSDNMCNLFCSTGSIEHLEGEEIENGTKHIGLTCFPSDADFHQPDTSSNSKVIYSPSSMVIKDNTLIVLDRGYVKSEGSKVLNDRVYTIDLSEMVSCKDPSKPTIVYYTIDDIRSDHSSYLSSVVTTNFMDGAIFIVDNENRVFFMDIEESEEGKYHGSLYLLLDNQHPIKVYSHKPEEGCSTGVNCNLYNISVSSDGQRLFLSTYSGNTILSISAYDIITSIVPLDNDSFGKIKIFKEKDNSQKTIGPVIVFPESNNTIYILTNVVNLSGEKEPVILLSGSKRLSTTILTHIQVTDEMGKTPELTPITSYLSLEAEGDLSSLWSYKIEDNGEVGRKNIRTVNNKYRLVRIHIGSLTLRPMFENEKHGPVLTSACIYSPIAIFVVLGTLFLIALISSCRHKKETTEFADDGSALDTSSYESDTSSFTYDSFL